MLAERFVSSKKSEGVSIKTNWKKVAWKQRRYFEKSVIPLRISRQKLEKPHNVKKWKGVFGVFENPLCCEISKN